MRRPGSGPVRAAIVGIAGATLAGDEAALFRECPPAGVILFARNVAEPVQLRRLTAELRRVLPVGAVLMVDQEGGRVARLRPPSWRAHPPAGKIGAAFARSAQAGLRAAWLTGALIGLDCAAAGFDVACAPVLDLRWPGAHDVVGNRAFAADSGTVARLGRAAAAGLLAAGIQPVMKHLPGHGRAMVDSHFAMPRVEAPHLDDDLQPFALNTDLPWAMSAHVLYSAWDAARPATLSPSVIEGVIRRRIGFAGVLVTDDLAMRALTGAPEELARAALAAGCDLALYCAGDFDSNAALLRSCPALTSETETRLASARFLAARRRLPLGGDALAAQRERLLPAADPRDVQ